MKKVFYSLLVLTGIFVVVSSTGCKKKTTSSTNPITTTATIKGKVQAELNTTNTSFAWENAPAGTRVIAIINAAQLLDNPDPDVTYGNIEYAGTLNSEGEFSISVAAGTKPVNVTIQCDEFAYLQITSTTGSTTRKVFSGADGNATVYKDQIKWVDMNYDIP